MARSTTTTVLPDKTVNIPFGELDSNLITGLIWAAFSVGCFLLPVLVQATWAIVIGWGLGGLVVLCLIFYPISVAMDVGDRIPEVKDARNKDKELKKIVIPHPHLWAIILLNIASFWSVIGWIVAMAWACSPGKVMIPDKLFANIFDKDAPVKPEKTPSSPSQVPTNPSLEAQLTEINQLVERGLLTKDEADSRKGLILSR